MSVATKERPTWVGSYAAEEGLVPFGEHEEDVPGGGGAESSMMHSTPRWIRAELPGSRSAVDSGQPNGR